MGDHNAFVVYKPEGGAYGLCTSCGWQTGVVTHEDAERAVSDHLVGLPV